MFIDIAEFTSLAHTDEPAALRLLQEQDRLVRPILETHRGRRIKSTGDGLLIEFPNVLDAVECGVDLQRRIHEHNAREGTPPLRVRVGIHLGDVQRKGGDIFGDAVNIASRIEPLADPGGVCLSEPVYVQVRNKVPYQLEKLGAKSLKGVRESMDVYRVVFPWVTAEVGSGGTLPPRLAVLPLRNISPDPKDEYFADGLTEELISTLSKVSELSVISRTSVMQYRDRSRPVAEIGKELNLGNIIEGSVRKSGNRVRVAIQLIDTNQDRHLWSESYDRELQDIFAMQSDIAERVAAALKIRLLASEQSDIKRKPTKNMEAYELYLKGQSHRARETREELALAMSCFEEALAKDQNCAIALVGWAECYHWASHSNLFPPEETYPQMKRFTVRALEIDPRLAEAHIAMGAIYFHYEWNWREAEKEFLKAIELRPSSPEAYDPLSYLLAILGRSAESYEKAQRCLELSPQIPSVETWAHSGASYMGTVLFSDRPADRIELLEKMMEVHQESTRVHEVLGYAYLRGKRFEEAISQLEEAVRLSKGETLFRADLAIILARAGHRKEASAMLAELEEISRHSHVSPVQLAFLLESLGRRDDAYVKLESAYERRATDLANVRLVPELAELRADSRWRSIERRMGLPEL